LTFYPLRKFIFWVHINVVVLLTWIGARPVEDPYIFVGQILSVVYFSYYFFQVSIIKFWDKLLN
jgi:ubiquinol-cytochrome c reductase cytochrome b subunit